MGEQYVVVAVTKDGIQVLAPRRSSEEKRPAKFYVEVISTTGEAVS